MEQKSKFTGYKSSSKNTARTLRGNMTETERKLWFQFLRTYPVKWYRQRPVDDYIVDFYCSKAKIVIELDGSQHYLPDGIESDKTRTERLRQYGLEVLRFSNLDVQTNFYGVCTVIDEIVKKRMEML